MSSICRRPRVAIAGFMHESNTFNASRTGRAAFEQQGLRFGDALLDEWKNAHHEMGGFLEAADIEGFDPLPILMAWAMPAGPVTDEMLDMVTERITAELKALQPDGLLLALHGAMVAESYPDGDGEVLKRIRQAMGPGFPIVTTFDLHGNISQQQIDACQAALAYRTCPHVDQRQCGRRAASLLARMLSGAIRPCQALAKPAQIINIMVHDTSQEPLRTFMDHARQLEERSGILAASLLCGFPYADVPQMGPAVIVVTDGDQALARREADSLAGLLWENRAKLTAQLPDAATAVAQALRAERLPVVLVETGDNVGGGSAADSTVILAEMLSQRATGGVVCLYAPTEAAACAAAGIGQRIRLQVGGKVDRLHGEPVAVEGRIRVLHDGEYTEHAARHGGKRHNLMGLTALLELDGDNLLVLTSERHPPFSLGQLTCLGIDPAHRRLIVVKAAIAYKSAYLPIAGTIIEVDTPGLTAVNPFKFNYRHIRRPMYPLD